MCPELGSYFLSKEIYVITPETISAILTTGLIICIIKNYGASIGEFADKLSEQKIAQWEEAKQAPIKNIQDAVDLKSQKELAQKCCYLFDVQRNSIAIAWKVTYKEWPSRGYEKVKKGPNYHISVQIMMRQKEQEHVIKWVEKHIMQSLSAQQEETPAKCTADLKLQRRLKHSQLCECIYGDWDS